MEALIRGFFNLDILAQAWPILLAGFWMTLLLALVVVPLGFAGGLAVALACTTRNFFVRAGVVGYVDFFRAFPPLVLLMLVAYGLPFLDIRLGAFGSVALAFFLNTSSYYGEILRAGIESVPRGQLEAARSTEHAGGDQAHLDRERGGAARAAARGARSAGADLQRDADHRRRYHLPRVPVAAGAAAFALRASPDRLALMDRILVINPNSSAAVTRGIDEACAPLRMAGGPAIECVTLKEGPPGIETQEHVDGVVQPLLHLVRASESRYAAFVIACYSDPGLHSLREATRKPVLGISESGILTALTLGQKFGVIAILQQSIPRHLRYMGALGVMDRLAGELPVDLPVVELADEKKTFGRMVDAGRALRGQGAGVIVMGCAGMARYRKPLQDALGIPVVEPTQAAVSMAIGRVRLGWEAA